ncbi:MAG: ACT domain-containing protein [Pseudomonadales bacterium]
MTGIVELDELLSSMSPELMAEEYAFCTVDGELRDYLHLQPLATFIEAEGLTLVVTIKAAEKQGLAYEGVFKRITLTVHSSLEAVGLTAAIATRLSASGISANVIAAYYHDHVFVQADKADEALLALNEFSKASS